MGKRVVSSVLIAAMVCGTLIGCGATQTKEKEATVVNAELKKIADHLEEVTYDSLDYDYAKTVFEKYKGEVTPGCTSIYKDGMLMRNLDWSLKYNGVDVSEVVVHTKATDETYATVGVAYVPGVSDDNYDSLSEEEQKIVPFSLVDGMNSEGLMVSINVVPENDEISNTSGTNPDGEDLCSLMTVRSLIDHCANVDEAIEYLKDHNFYMVTKTGSDYRQECHYLIADKDRAVIVEFVDNEMRVLEQDDLPYDTVFMTNHYLYNGGENTGHGMGYERDQIVLNGIDQVDASDWKTGMNLLESVKYSQAYTLPLGDGFRYSEYYTQFEKDGKTYDINKDTANDDPIMLAAIEEGRADWEQQADNCWWSSHSSVYDSKAGTLHLVIREQFDKVYDFTLDEDID